MARVTPIGADVGLLQLLIAGRRRCRLVVGTARLAGRRGNSSGRQAKHQNGDRTETSEKSDQHAGKPSRPMRVANGSIRMCQAVYRRWSACRLAAGIKRSAKLAKPLAGQRRLSKHRPFPVVVDTPLMLIGHARVRKEMERTGPAMRWTPGSRDRFRPAKTSVAPMGTGGWTWYTHVPNGMFSD